MIYSCSSIITKVVKRRYMGRLYIQIRDIQEKMIKSEILKNCIAQNCLSDYNVNSLKRPGGMILSALYGGLVKIGER